MILGFTWWGILVGWDILGGKEAQDERKKEREKKLWVLFRSPVSVGFEKLLEAGVGVWPYTSWTATL